jgi:hypothetical protein
MNEQATDGGYSETYVRRLEAERDELKRELADTLFGPTMVQNLNAENKRLKKKCDELLAALKRLVTSWDGGDIARAAIAKAEGAR